MKNFLIAIQFLTRIPIPMIEFTEKDNFVNSVKYYPLVGLIIGLILAVTAVIFDSYLPPLVLAAVIMVVNLFISGGLHLDGFMDTVDGLMSAREKERMLEIMKDSRVGAHSVWAVVSLLITKFAIIASLSFQLLPLTLLLMPVISRWQVLFSMSFWPYARETGLGKLFLAQKHKAFFYLNGIVIFSVVFYITGILGLVALLTNLFFIAMINNHIVKKLEGLTGDTYGAVIEISEVTILFMFLILLK